MFSFLLQRKHHSSLLRCLSSVHIVVDSPPKTSVVQVQCSAKRMTQVRKQKAKPESVGPVGPAHPITCLSLSRRVFASCCIQQSAPELDQLRLPTLHHRLHHLPWHLIRLRAVLPWILQSGPPSPWRSTMRRAPAPAPARQHPAQRTILHRPRWTAVAPTITTPTAVPQQEMAETAVAAAVAAGVAVAPRVAHRVAVAPVPAAIRAIEATAAMTAAPAVGLVARAPGSRQRHVVFHRSILGNWLTEGQCRLSSSA
jgi:hypothetical protein